MQAAHTHRQSAGTSSNMQQHEDGDDGSSAWESGSITPAQVGLGWVHLHATAQNKGALRHRQQSCSDLMPQKQHTYAVP